MSTLVSASNLVIEYHTPRGTVRALDGADLVMEIGTSLGLVGESGSGKTTLGMAMGRLLPPNAVSTAGSLEVGGQNVFEMSASKIAKFRRDELGVIFQNPMSALNPTTQIGKQVGWALGENGNAEEVLARLRQVGLSDVERVAKSYPHELSGGMAQRVIITMAIARRPSLLIADEPTASLDASIRGQILDLLISQKEEAGAAFVLLSHELTVVAGYCEMIGVMYGGRVVELATSAEIFNAPMHPYTQALLRAAPGKEMPGERLEPIQGAPPVLTGSTEGCAFAPRCPRATEICRTNRPTLRTIADHQILCHNIEEERDGVFDPSAAD